MHRLRPGTSLLDAVQAVNKFVYSRTPAEKYLTLVVLRSSASGWMAGSTWNW